MGSSYIHFLKIIDAFGRSNASHRLDSIEINLLEHLLLEQYKGQSLLVSNLIHLRQFGSQATLHARVKSLTTHGYVKLLVDKVDRRKKFVVPTTLTHKYIQFLSECMEASLKSS